MKVFNFSIPVTGTEYYNVKAETLEEAIELLQGDCSKYKDGDDIDWVLGLGCSRKKIEYCFDCCFEVDDE